MTRHNAKLANPPIVEAVLDLDCDMPPSQDIAGLEAPALASYRDRYPKMRTLFLPSALGVFGTKDPQTELPAGVDPRISTQRRIQAFRFLMEDERQLVQVRAEGFSFNRLAPYTSLDDYLPEIERTWRLFVSFASPVQVRVIRLRYINRIVLPLVERQVKLADYLRYAPGYPDQDRFTLRGFFNQHAALEADTGNQLKIVLTTKPWEQDWLPIIFDIEALREEAVGPDDWDTILARIHSLRSSKNRVFTRMLTRKCLDLFR